MESALPLRLINFDLLATGSQDCCLAVGTGLTSLALESRLGGVLHQTAALLGLSHACHLLLSTTLARTLPLRLGCLGLGS